MKALAAHLEDVSAGAQTRALPDIHHLLGYVSKSYDVTVVPGVNNKPASQITPEELDYISGPGELFLSFIKVTME